MTKALPFSVYRSIPRSYGKDTVILMARCRTMRMAKVVMGFTRLRYPHHSVYINGKDPEVIF